jgi:hypothetical protein
MQWSEEEFLKWVREHPTVEDLIERTKDQPPDSEAGSKRPLWNRPISAYRHRVQTARPWFNAFLLIATDPDGQGRR